MSQRASFQFEIEAFRKDLLDLADRAPGIIARALNRAAVSGQVAMVKVITADTGLLAKYVKRDIKLDKASRTLPKVTVTIEGRRLPLIAFGARGPRPTRGRGRGVTYGLRGGRTRIPNAFIATVPNAGPEANWHEGVFIRDLRGAGSRRKSVGAWSKNLPIRQLRGPSVPHVFEKHLDKFRAAAEESFLKNLASEITFEKSKNQPASEPA